MKRLPVHVAPGCCAPKAGQTDSDRVAGTRSLRG